MTHLRPPISIMNLLRISNINSIASKEVVLRRRGVILLLLLVVVVVVRLLGMLDRGIEEIFIMIMVRRFTLIPCGSSTSLCRCRHADVL